MAKSSEKITFLQFVEIVIHWSSLGQAENILSDMTKHRLVLVTGQGMAAKKGCSAWDGWPQRLHYADFRYQTGH